MSHTPGPWDAGRFEPEEGQFVYVVDGPPAELGDGAVFGPQIADNIRSEDDARLIAAAPDLLAALEEIVYGIYEGTGLTSDEMRYVARQAIAKATGAEVSA